MATETFLSAAGLENLHDLVGQQLSEYGTDLEVDEGLAAFDVWLNCENGRVCLS